MEVTMAEKKEGTQPVPVEDRRSGKDRRSGDDRREGNNSAFEGPERRRSRERRSGDDRRTATR